ISHDRLIKLAQCYADNRPNDARGDDSQIKRRRIPPGDKPARRLASVVQRYSLGHALPRTKAAGAAVQLVACRPQAGRRRWNEVNSLAIHVVKAFVKLL